MFSTSTAPSIRTGRSSRQSGLKKPRPLRSVSLQEPTDNDVKKTTPERQLSQPANTTVGIEFAVCESISAMSALFAAQAESETEGSSSHTYDQKDTFQEKRLSFDRQDSNSSYNSCLESSECGSSFSLSRHNSIPSENSTTQKYESTPKSFTHSYSYENDSKGSTGVDMNSNNIGNNGSYQDSSLSLSRNEEEFANVPLVSLLTSQGEKLIVTGRNMQTVLNASKILVREMNASIVSMRFEDLHDEDTNPTQEKSESPSPTNLSPSPMTEQQPKKEKKVFRYSKEDLLSLSDCEIARKPPANWNILMHTHSDCCVPAYKMKEFFEAIDFHSHDGTLVTEDKRIRDRRDRDLNQMMGDDRLLRDKRERYREQIVI